MKPSSSRRLLAALAAAALASSGTACRSAGEPRARPFGGVREYFVGRPTYPPAPSPRPLTLGNYAAYNYGPARRLPPDPAVAPPLLFGN